MIRYYNKYDDVLNSKQIIKKYPLLIPTFIDWLIKYSSVDTFKKRRMRFGNHIIYNIEDKRDYQKAIIDFIAGMTDNFALKVYNEIIRF